MNNAVTFNELGIVTFAAFRLLFRFLCRIGSVGTGVLV